MKDKYTKTIYACFTGYVVQAIVNNFAPLLFLTFAAEYGISLGRITALIAVNFGVQLTVDLLSAFTADKIGYRRCIVAAHAFSAAGFVLLTALPEIIDPFTGLLIAVVVYATGGGLLEVLVSPIVEALPTSNKEKAMSMLHSFYCWGQAGVVLLSTVYFTIFGTENWKLLALMWAIIPILNLIAFTRVPILTLTEDNEKGMGITELLKNAVFWLMALMMTASAACELSISQWASAFAESGLGISKTAGDLAGPMFFALLMGTSRALYGKFGDKINLRVAMLGSAALCLVSYLVTSLAQNPLISLFGCGICGFSVGIMWPGTFSTAAAAIRRGGTLMFGLLALAGDLGCSAGPAVVGFVAERAGGSLNTGIFAAAAFPALLCLLLCLPRRKTDDSREVQL